MPNPLFGFVKTDTSFHGVEELTEPDVIGILWPTIVTSDDVTRLAVDHCHNCLEASFAPSARDSSFAHCTSGWQRTIL